MSLQVATLIEAIGCGDGVVDRMQPARGGAGLYYGPKDCINIKILHSGSRPTVREFPKQFFEVNAEVRFLDLDRPRVVGLCVYTGLIWKSKRCLTGGFQFSLHALGSSCT